MDTITNKGFNPATSKLNSSIIRDTLKRPYHLPYLVERDCDYCGEIFYAHHGLQRYCPEKYGKKGLCQYEQKKMLSEARLVERVQELSLTGMRVYPENPTDKNKKELRNIMGSERQKTVNSDLLDSKGYDINYFDFKEPINGTNKYLLHVGEYTIDWIGKEGTVLTFKIIKK